MSYQVNIEANYELEWQYTYNGATEWKSNWPTEFGISYESLLPSIPEGLRIVTYNEDGSYDIDNLPVSGGEKYFRSGKHPLLFYNNGTEYIVFNDLGQYADARVSTRVRSRASYLGNRYMNDEEEETTVNPPDMLFGHYMESYEAVKSEKPTTLPITLRPLVFTYFVRYEFSHGLEYVALARGALAGMARSVYLNSGRTSNEAATVLYDCTLEKFGTQAAVHSFGIPDFPNSQYSRGDRKYGLNLEVRLTNGKILSFDFDVTDQVSAQPHGGVIVVSGIDIPDDIGSASGSGFDVSVSGWGEFIDIDLKL